MILLDANILIYARVSEMKQHPRIQPWLDEQLNASPRVGLPWPSILGFVRIVTNRRVFREPESVTSAWAQIESWLDLPSTWIPQPTEHHRAVLGTLLGEANRSELVPDAHLAALALEHGLELCSTDGDFARFPGLRWTNPLAST